MMMLVSISTGNVSFTAVRSLGSTNESSTKLRCSSFGFISRSRFFSVESPCSIRRNGSIRIVNTTILNTTEGTIFHTARKVLIMIGAVICSIDEGSTKLRCLCAAFRTALNSHRISRHFCCSGECDDILSCFNRSEAITILRYLCTSRHACLHIACANRMRNFIRISNKPCSRNTSGSRNKCPKCRHFIRTLTGRFRNNRHISTDGYTCLGSFHSLLESRSKCRHLICRRSCNGVRCHFFAAKRCGNFIESAFHSGHFRNARNNAGRFRKILKSFCGHLVTGEAANGLRHTLRFTADGNRSTIFMDTAFHTDRLFCRHARNLRYTRHNTRVLGKAFCTELCGYLIAVDGTAVHGHSIGSNGYRSTGFVERTFHSGRLLVIQTRHIRCTGDDARILCKTVAGKFCRSLITVESTNCLRHSIDTSNNVGRFCLLIAVHLRADTLTIISCRCFGMTISSISLLCIHSSKYRSIIECTSALTAGHLVPLTSIRGSDHTMRSIRFLILGCIEHIHAGFLSIRGSCSRTDVSTSDLRTLHLEALHMRHIVAEAAICNVSGDHTGSIGRSACNRRNRIAIKCCAVSGSDSAKGTGNKACTAAKSHPGTTVYNGITHIGIGAELGSKACGKTACRSTGPGSCTSTSAEYTASASCTASCTGKDSGCHKQFHTHTGAGLSHIQSNGCQVAVKALRTLEISQCAEHPEEDTSFSG